MEKVMVIAGSGDIPEWNEEDSERPASGDSRSAPAAIAGEWYSNAARATDLVYVVFTVPKRVIERAAHIRTGPPKKIVELRSESTRSDRPADRLPQRSKLNARLTHVYPREVKMLRAAAVGRSDHISSAPPIHSLSGGLPMELTTYDTDAVCPSPRYLSIGKGAIAGQHLDMLAFATGQMRGAEG